ncbi:hypothetical protein [Novipirellula maiorica]|nr:hypothetical protein [Rhodopirellula maiorica]
MKFSLATLLAAVAVSAAWFSHIHNSAANQRDATVWLDSIHTGLWRYDSDPQHAGFADPATRDSRGTVEPLFGPDYVHDIEEVLAYDPALGNLNQIAKLRKLTTLNIGSDTQLDLSALPKLSHLKQLTIHAQGINTLEPLHHMAALDSVLIIDTPVDPNELAALKNARPELQIQVTP